MGSAEEYPQFIEVFLNFWVSIIVLPHFASYILFSEYGQLGVKFFFLKRGGTSDQTVVVSALCPRDDVGIFLYVLN